MMSKPRSRKKIKCAWCDTMVFDHVGQGDGYYLAWDWYVCQACFDEIEMTDSEIAFFRKAYPRPGAPP